MDIGASTACFYPLETEKALEKVIELGYPKAEVFFNTTSELEPDFVKKMKEKADDSGVKITSVHPFSSNLENNCIFGEYQRRYDDFVGLYRQHCNAAAILGAKYLVIHGSYSKLKRPLPEEHYFDRFSSLVEIGKEEGVTVCQENVVRFRSESVDFLKRMKNYLGSDFNMVFDVKQAVRSGYDPFYVLEEMKDSIVHIHLSDNNESCDCLPPGRGTFDFKKMFNILENSDYKGDCVIEIYSRGFDVESELSFSKKFFDEF